MKVIQWNKKIKKYLSFNKKFKILDLQWVLENKLKWDVVNFPLKKYSNNKKYKCKNSNNKRNKFKNSNNL